MDVCLAGIRRKPGSFKKKNENHPGPGGGRHVAIGAGIVEWRDDDADSRE
jgi:hypothetical protein